MSMNLLLRQLSESKLQHLVDNPADILDFVDDKVPAAQELNLHKDWHGLHFLLTGEAWDGAEPLCYLMSEGTQIGDEEEHDVGYGPARGLHARQVQHFAQALMLLTEQELRRRYDGPKMAQLDLYPGGWEEDPDEAVKSLVSSFRVFQQFVARAAGQQQALLLWMQ